MLNIPPKSKPGGKIIKSVREYIFNTLTFVPFSEASPKLADESSSSQEHDVFASMRTAGSLPEI
jgi:hypothetical protein